MNCPYCGKEMIKGVTSYWGIGSVAVGVMASFLSDEEAKKSMFKQNAINQMLLTGSKAEAYHCPDCRKVVSVTDVK